MPLSPLSERNLAIYKRRQAGEDYVSLSRAYGLSAPRVRAIVLRVREVLSGDMLDDSPNHAEVEDIRKAWLECRERHARTGHQFCEAFGCTDLTPLFFAIDNLRARTS